MDRGSELRSSRVHFPEDQVLQHDSAIVMDSSIIGELHAYLGFLQLNNHYQITLPIEDTLGQKIVCDPPAKGCVCLTETKAVVNGHELVIIFKANREKQMIEELTLSNPAHTKNLTLFLHASILGKDKGTPALREGIRCVEKGDPKDPESQRSEFVRSDSFKNE